MFHFKALALIAVFGLAASLPVVSHAADDKAPRREAGPRGERKDHPRGERGERDERGNFVMRMLFKDITLSDAQKDSLKKMRGENMAKGKAFAEAHKDELKKHHDAMKAWRETNKEKFKALRLAGKEAKDNKDRQAMQKVQADLKALLESRPPMPEKLKAGMPSPERMAEQVRGILNKDQVAQFDANLKAMKERKEKFEKDGPPPRHEGKRGEKGEKDEGKGGGEDRPRRRRAPKPE